MHHHFFFFPFFAMILRLGFLVFVCYVCYKWVTKFFAQKQEHNELLREILKKMENR